MSERGNTVNDMQGLLRKLVERLNRVESKISTEVFTSNNFVLVEELGAVPPAGLYVKNVSVGSVNYGQLTLIALK